MDWIESSLLLALFVGFAIGVANHARVIRILRDRHPDTWRSLGSPTLIRNNSISNSRRLRTYIKSGDCESLQDSDLNRTVRLGRFIEWGYLLVLLLFGFRFAASLMSG
jgi:hypothetical protein